MTGLLLAFAVVALVPLFVSRWRTSLLGLSAQAGIMAAIAFREGLHIATDDAITFLDLVVVRTILAPLLLYFVLRTQNIPGRNDVIAPNLLSWAIALALVVMAFGSADTLIPTEGDEQMQLAVSAAAFLLGFFVLATSRGTISQTIGLMRLENAIALFELGNPHREWLAIRVGQLAVLLISVGYFRWFLVHHRPDDAPQSQARGAVL